MLLNACRCRCYYACCMYIGTAAFKMLLFRQLGIWTRAYVRPEKWFVHFVLLVVNAIHDVVFRVTNMPENNSSCNWTVEDVFYFKSSNYITVSRGIEFFESLKNCPVHINTLILTIKFLQSCQSRSRFSKQNIFCLFPFNSYVFLPVSKSNIIFYSPTACFIFFSILF